MSRGTRALLGVLCLGALLALTQARPSQLQATGRELLEAAAAAPAPAPQPGAAPAPAPAPGGPATDDCVQQAASSGELAVRALSEPCGQAPTCSAVDVAGAAELLRGGHAYLDVRTEEEFAAGRPAGAANVPAFLRQGGAEAQNAAFLEQVAALFPDKGAPIVVGCKTGRRSAAACEAMAAAGYSRIASMDGGFVEWAAAGLPTEP